MAVGCFDTPSVPDGSKDLGAVLVAWWPVPSDPTDLVVESGRESRRRGPKARVRVVRQRPCERGLRVSTQLLWLQTSKRGPRARTVAGPDVNADNPLGTVGSTMRGALILKSHASVGGSSREVRVNEHN